jgi:hypothetical protein
MNEIIRATAFDDRLMGYQSLAACDGWVLVNASTDGSLFHFVRNCRAPR